MAREILAHVITDLCPVQVTRFKNRSGLRRWLDFTVSLETVKRLVCETEPYGGYWCAVRGSRHQYEEDCGAPAGHMTRGLGSRDEHVNLFGLSVYRIKSRREYFVLIPLTKRCVVGYMKWFSLQQRIVILILLNQ